VTSPIYEFIDSIRWLSDSIFVGESALNASSSHTQSTGQPHQEELKGSNNGFMPDKVEVWCRTVVKSLLSVSQHIVTVLSVKHGQRACRTNLLL
jgi:hypothetical protein